MINLLESLHIGDVISALRKEKGLSQEQLAELIEISQPQLSAIENGRQQLKVPLFYKICVVLKLDPLAFALRLLTHSLILRGIESNILQDEQYEYIGNKLRELVSETFRQTLEDKKTKELESFLKSITLSSGSPKSAPTNDEIDNGNLGGKGFKKQEEINMVLS